MSHKRKYPHSLATFSSALRHLEGPFSCDQQLKQNRLELKKLSYYYIIKRRKRIGENFTLVFLKRDWTMMHADSF